MCNPKLNIPSPGQPLSYNYWLEDKSIWEQWNIGIFIGVRLYHFKPEIPSQRYLLLLKQERGGVCINIVLIPWKLVQSLFSNERFSGSQV